MTILFYVVEMARYAVDREDFVSYICSVGMTLFLPEVRVNDSSYTM